MTKILLASWVAVVLGASALSYTATPASAANCQYQYSQQYNPFNNSWSTQPSGVTCF